MYALLTRYQGIYLGSDWEIVQRTTVLIKVCAGIPFEGMNDSFQVVIPLFTIISIPTSTSPSNTSSSSSSFSHLRLEETDRLFGLR